MPFFLLLNKIRLKHAIENCVTFSVKSMFYSLNQHLPVTRVFRSIVKFNKNTFFDPVAVWHLMGLNNDSIFSQNKTFHGLLQHFCTFWRKMFSFKHNSVFIVLPKQIDDFSFHAHNFFDKCFGISNWDDSRKQLSLNYHWTRTQIKYEVSLIITLVHVFHFVSVMPNF